MISPKEREKWLEVMGVLSNIIEFGPTDIDIWVFDRLLVIDGDKYEEHKERSYQEWRLNDVDYVMHVADVMRYVLQGSCGVVTIRRGLEGVK